MIDYRQKEHLFVSACSFFVLPTLTQANLYHKEKNDSENNVPYDRVRFTLSIILTCSHLITIIKSKLSVCLKYCTLFPHPQAKH